MHTTTLWSRLKGCMMQRQMYNIVEAVKKVYFFAVFFVITILV